MITIPIIRGFSEIEHIYNIVKETGSNICGGYPRYMCSPTADPVKAGDVDVFPGDSETLEKARILIQNLGYTVKHENDVSITYANPVNGIHTYHPTVQLIKPVNAGRIDTTGDWENIIDNFDFTVVRIAIKDRISCVADDDFLEDEKRKRLVFKNIHCPVSSLLRANKYAKKGYWLAPRESLKLFKDWDLRSDDYKARLVELFEVADKSTEENKMSQKEVDELEALLRVD
jgi:hypothetical protein